jgi:DNA-binding protein H-NS
VFGVCIKAKRLDEKAFQLTPERIMTENKNESLQEELSEEELQALANLEKEVFAEAERNAADAGADWGISNPKAEAREEAMSELEDMEKRLEKLKEERNEIERRRIEIAQEIERVSQARRDSAKAAILAQMKELDISVADLTDAKPQKPKGVLAKTPPPPKYQNPANPAETWSGRGKAPEWARKAKEAGTLADCRIKP